jgi:hypothetical protein
MMCLELWEKSDGVHSYSRPCPAAYPCRLR